MNAPAPITAEQLAELSNLTKRRLYQLAEKGKIPSADNGIFPMLETITALFKYYQADDGSLLAAKIKKMEAEAELAEIELGRAKGKLLPVEKVRAHLGAVLVAIKSVIVTSGLSRPEQNDLLTELIRLGEKIDVEADEAITLEKQ